MEVTSENSASTPARGRPGAKQSFSCPIRDVLDRVGDAWTVLVVMTLKKGPVRFNELRRQVNGVSQRMLTVTLRQLERDGLVSRCVIPSTPPQVEYSLTELGLSLHEALNPLAEWAARSQSAVRETRQKYDDAAGLK
jgi:DNA-binding HxlR family transcriptional regulator